MNFFRDIPLNTAILLFLLMCLGYAMTGKVMDRLPDVVRAVQCQERTAR